MAEGKKSEAIGAELRALYREASPAQRRAIWQTFWLTGLATVAELFTIGAVLPVLVLVSGGAATPPPVARLFSGFLGTGDPATALPRAVGLLAVAAIVTALIRLAMTHTSQKLVFTLGQEINAGIFSRMLRQPYSAYVGRNPSEIFAGMEKTQVLIHGVLLPLMLGATASVLAAGILVLLLVLAPGLILAGMLGIICIYGAVSLASRGRLRANSVVMSRMSTARMRALQEGHGGLRDIMLDRAQHVFEDKFNRLDRAHRQAQAANQFLAHAPRYVVEAAGTVLVGLLALHFSRQPGGLIAALPVLGALALGTQRMLPLVNSAYFGWSQFAGNRQVLRDVLELMRMPILPPGEDATPRPLARAIEFVGVSLRHPERQAALDDINLTITRGERIGIVGGTGSGKSSLLDLMMGIIEPTEGRVLVDGVTLDDASRAGWQAALAHVPQSIYLADASIAANIAFSQADEAVDIERVRRAAQLAMLDPFLETLERGLATEVGDRGVALSGGQRQRIGIARAMFKTATLLVLDEATGQLDPETEAAVLNMIFALPRDHTIVIVAHNPSGLRGVERIIRMEGGRILEDRPA